MAVDPSACFEVQEKHEGGDDEDKDKRIFGGEDVIRYPDRSFAAWAADVSHAGPSGRRGRIARHAPHSVIQKYEFFQMLRTRCVRSTHLTFTAKPRLGAAGQSAKFLQ